MLGTGTVGGSYVRNPPLNICKYDILFNWSYRVLPRNSDNVENVFPATHTTWRPEACLSAGASLLEMPATEISHFFSVSLLSFKYGPCYFAGDCASNISCLIGGCISDQLVNCYVLKKIICCYRNTYLCGWRTSQILSNRLWFNANFFVTAEQYIE